jgi:hypothetical protein
MVWREGNGCLPQHGVHSQCSRRVGVVCVAACAVAEAEERCGRSVSAAGWGGSRRRGRCGCGGRHRGWRRLRVSSHHRSLGSPAHACNVSCAHRTISLDSNAAPRRAAAGARHGGRARRPPESSTPAGRCAAECAAVPSSLTPALDTPEISTWTQTTAAWFRAGL